MSPFYFLAVFAFFAGAFVSSLSLGALRFSLIRELFRVPGVGAFFSFLGAFGLVSLFLVAAFFPLFALGLSSFSSFFPSTFCLASSTSSFFSPSDLCSGAPFFGSFFEPGVGLYPPPWASYSFESFAA